MRNCAWCVLVLGAGEEENCAQPRAALLDKIRLTCCVFRYPAIISKRPHTARHTPSLRHHLELLHATFHSAGICVAMRDLPTLATGYRQAFDFWYQRRRCFTRQYMKFVMKL